MQEVGSGKQSKPAPMDHMHLPNIHHHSPAQNSHNQHGKSKHCATQHADLQFTKPRVSVPSSGVSNAAAHQTNNESCHKQFTTKHQSTQEEARRKQHLHALDVDVRSVSVNHNDIISNYDLAHLLGNSTSEDWFGMDLDAVPERSGLSYKTRTAYDDMMASLSKARKQLRAAKELGRAHQHTEEGERSRNGHKVRKEPNNTQRKDDAPNETMCQARRHRSEPNKLVTTDVVASSPCRQSQGPVVRQWVWPPSGDEICAPVARASSMDIAMVVIGSHEVVSVAILFSFNYKMLVRSG